MVSALSDRIVDKLLLFILLPGVFAYNTEFSHELSDQKPGTCFNYLKLEPQGPGLQQEPHNCDEAA